ncbi:MAG: peptidylprolyl isomerase [Thermoguttaceae bacterium]|jgi:hypothetical protein
MKSKTRYPFPSLFIGAALSCGAIFPAVGEEPRTDRVSMAGDASYNIKLSPPVTSSRIYYEGSETLGRVGHEAILKRDIFHQIRKYAYLEFLKQKDRAPENERGKFNEEYCAAIRNEFLASDRIYSQVLEEYICQLLFYNDYIVSRSKDEIEEQKKILNKTFDSEYLPNLMEQMHCETQDELESLFKEKLESSLDEERRLFIQQTISGSWVAYNLGSDQWEPTSHDLRRYYEKHRDDYKKPEQVRWQKMSVYFSNHRTKEEARKKIAYMGNAVRSAVNRDGRGSAFAKVAHTDSEDIFAPKGGECGWTKRGEISSAIIDTALFSDDLPVGALSRIFEDEAGLSIVRVLERQKERLTPFVEVQEEIAEKIKEERQRSLKAKYEAELAKRFAVQIYKISPEDRKTRFEAISHNAVSATGRE